MTWTYDSSDPGATDKDQVRLMIGDTDETDEQLQDQEIAHFLTLYITVGAAAVASARAIMAKFARKVTKAVGDLRISLSDRYRHYQDLVAYLETVAESTDPYQVYAAGQSVSEADADAQDTNLPQPGFKVGMHDYPLVSRRADTRDPFLS